MLIVFEGIDRSGKSTQCQRLREALEALGHLVKCHRHPDRTMPYIGSLINDYLSKTVDISPAAASLLLASDLWARQPQLRQDAAGDGGGAIVLMDRYVWTATAYSTTRGTEESVMRRLTQGVLSPDLTILLKADPRVTAGRGDFGQERFDKIEFQTSVAEIMGRLCKEAPPEQVLVVDASLAPDRVAEIVLRAVLELIAKSTR